MITVTTDTAATPTMTDTHGDTGATPIASSGPRHMALTQNMVTNDDTSTTAFTAMTMTE